MEILAKVVTEKEVLAVDVVQFSKKTIQRNREGKAAKLAKRGDCQAREQCTKELIVEVEVWFVEVDCVRHGKSCVRREVERSSRNGASVLTVTFVNTEFRERKSKLW